MKMNKYIIKYTYLSKNLLLFCEHFLITVSFIRSPVFINSAFEVQFFNFLHISVFCTSGSLSLFDLEEIGIVMDTFESLIQVVPHVYTRLWHWLHGGTWDHLCWSNVTPAKTIRQSLMGGV